MFKNPSSCLYSFCLPFTSFRRLVQRFRRCQPQLDHLESAVTEEAEFDSSSRSSQDTVVSEKEVGNAAFRCDPLICLPQHIRCYGDSDSVARKFQPVHEVLTLNAFALIEPESWKSVTYDNADSEIWEIFRGIIWNDDPCCDLFDDSRSDKNRVFNSGTKFGSRYGLGKADFELATTLDWPLYGLRYGSLTGRSHFYDLKFLHSMAMKADEELSSVRSKILLWCEIMYRLATGDGIYADTRILDISTGSNGYQLRHFFDDDTSIKSNDTLFKLLTNNTKYKRAKIQKRALGSLLHVIQDSYAAGHTLRESTLENGGDLKVPGAIINFCHVHTQESRNQSDSHEMKIGSRVSPYVPYSTSGASAAIQASSTIIKFWQAGRPWKGAVESFICDSVFKCSQLSE